MNCAFYSPLFFSQYILTSKRKVIVNQTRFSLEDKKKRWSRQGALSALFDLCPLITRNIKKIKNQYIASDLRCLVSKSADQTTNMRSCTKLGKPILYKNNQIHMIAMD